MDGLLDRFIKDRIGELPELTLGFTKASTTFSTSAQSVIPLMPDTVKEAVYHLEHDEPVPSRKAQEVRIILDEYMQDFEEFRATLTALQSHAQYGRVKAEPLEEARLMFFEPFFDASTNALVANLNNGNALEPGEIATMQEAHELAFIEPMNLLRQEFEQFLDSQDDSFLGMPQQVRDLLQVIGEDVIMDQMDAGDFSSVTPYWLKRRMTTALDTMNRANPNYNPYWNAKRIRDVFDALKILRDQNTGARTLTDTAPLDRLN